MPKMKSHSGTKKRFTRTATGKLKAKKSGRKHLLSHKSRSRMRRLKNGVVLDNMRTKLVNSMLQN